MNGETGALARIESCSASVIWAEEQETGKRRVVDVERALPTVERHVAEGTPSARLLRLVRADDAIGLQVWVDVPRQPGLELTDRAVATEVRRAVEALVSVAVERVRRWGDDRSERLREELGRLADRWVLDAFRADDAHVGWHEGCVPSCDADVLVGTVTNPCAVVAASTQRWERNGRWANSKTLRIAVGPDRRGAARRSGSLRAAPRPTASPAPRTRRGGGF